MRDSYTNRNHCPSHEMWSYERDGRSSGVLLYKYVESIKPIVQANDDLNKTHPYAVVQ